MPKEYTGMPEPPLITSLRKKAKDTFVKKLTDAELDDVQELLKKCDAKNTGFFTLSEFKTVLKKLQDDECNMGKVPVFPTDDAVSQFALHLKGNAEDSADKILISTFLLNANKIEWRLLDKSELQARIDKLYAEVKSECNICDSLKN